MASRELWLLGKLTVALLALPSVAVVGLIYSGRTADTASPPPPPPREAAPVATAPPSLPPLVIPAGPEGDVIRRGQELVEHTYEAMPAHVGNGLHCTSCHLDGGRLPGAGPWIGLPGVFPEYRARSGRTDSLDRRINDCFERSMNGKPLDPASSEMKAILAYIDFLSRDAPGGKPPPGRGFKRIDPPREPDRAAGATKYAARCSSCHGGDGAGVLADGKYAFPPLWGDRAFNIGAGMARLDTAAAFLHANMPRGMPGTLSEQDAYDIADFMIHQPRPDFAGKVHDWPKGGKPRDARY